MKILRTSPARSAIFEAVVTGLIVLSLVVAGAGRAPIMNGDEARFAQAAREMAEGGSLIVPTFAGRDRYDKPILIYWLTAASYSLFGATPAAARLPSQVAAALAAALLAWRARRRWGPGSGALAGVLLAASPVFFVQARACTADSLNLLFTVAAMLALEELTIGDGRRRAAVVFWIALSLAVLTKGPVAPAFVAATLLGLWAISRRWRRWEISAGVLLFLGGALGLGPVILVVPVAFAAHSFFSSGADGRNHLRAFGAGWGVPLCLALTLGWAIAAWRATNGAYFHVALGRHVLERSLGPLEGHGGFPLFYLVTALIVCFPWAAFLVGAIPEAWRERFKDRESRFHLAWLFGSLLVLEVLGTKLVHYWMPAYPAAILIVVARLRLPTERTSAQWFSAAIHLLGGLVLAAVPLILVGYFDLDELRVLAAITTAVLVVGTVASIKGLTRGTLHSAILATSATLAYLIILVGLFLPALSPFLIGPATARQVAAVRLPDEPTTIYRLRDEDLLFHLPMGVSVCRSGDELTTFLENEGSALIVTRERDFRRLPDTHPARRSDVISTIQAIDLGRGRRVTSMILRRPSQHAFDETAKSE